MTFSGRRTPRYRKSRPSGFFEILYNVLVVLIAAVLIDHHLFETPSEVHSSRGTQSIASRGTHFHASVEIVVKGGVISCSLTVL